MIRILSILALILAAGAPARAELNEADRADIARVETYLSQIDTVEARFLQTSSDGSYAEGDIYIDRPGHMRIDYAPPVPVEVIATGTFLVYHDKKLKQASFVPLSSTPASVLLREEAQLAGDVTVTGVERGPASLRVSMVQADDQGAGELTLVFSDNPLMLRKWSVVDAQGIETTVSLIDTRFGVDLDPDMFEFTDPYRGRDDD